jgi:hypothetical protein
MTGFAVSLKSDFGRIRFQIAPTIAARFSSVRYPSDQSPIYRNTCDNDYASAMRGVCQRRPKQTRAREFTVTNKFTSKDLRPVLVAASMAVVFAAAGCSTTEAPSQNIVQKMSGEQPPIQTSGFLGDYSQLKPGNEGQSALV